MERAAEADNGYETVQTNTTNATTLNVSLSAADLMILGTSTQANQGLGIAEESG